MGELIRAIKDTPIPTILIVCGVAFLFLSIAGGIAGKIQVPPERQPRAMALGIVLLVLGIGISLVPLTPRGTGTGADKGSADHPAPSGPSDPGAVKRGSLTASNEQGSVLDAARGWTVVAQDSFDGGDNRWCYEDMPKKYGAVTAFRRTLNSKYDWQLNFEAPTFHYCSADVPPLNDFYARVDAQLDSGAKDAVDVGLMFRVIGWPGDRFYVFVVNGSWWQFMAWDGKAWRDWGWLPAKSARAGYNRLEVIGEGRRFYFFVNEEALGHLEDDAFALGRVGLYVQSRSPGGTRIEFRNFELRRKPATLK